MRTRTKTHGLTLVETTLVVSIAGLFLAVFVPVFVAEVRTSKISEASTELARMHSLSAAYFSTSHATDGGKKLRLCLPDVAGPTPAVPSTEARQVDFADENTPGHETWRSLGFQPEGPVRYRYAYLPIASGCGLGKDDNGVVLTMQAEGDLDGDGQTSLFERNAVVKDGRLVPSEILYVRDRVE